MCEVTMLVHKADIHVLLQICEFCSHIISHYVHLLISVPTFNTFD
jgi:hypothetical protein